MIMLLVAVILFIHTCLIWCWYKVTNNPSVVDVGWALGLVLAGMVYLFHSAWTLRIILLGLALLIWGVRLGGFLWLTRIKPKHVDKRYLALSENWQIAKPLGFFLNFLFQAVLIFIISLPWYFISLNISASISWFDFVGLIVYVVALTLESAADQQLINFKKSHPGQVCDVKLWKYSRHPNYFFEWVIWCVFALFALSTAYGWLAIISPLTLYFIMTRVTAPLTEQGSIRSKGQMYINYQSKTPMFFLKWW